MTSPLCLINGFSTTNGVDVTKNTTVTIQLIDTAGVGTWEIECIGTDDLLTTAIINNTLTITDLVAKTATFTMPNGDGYSTIFRSRVNQGVDINGRAVSSYTTTFKVATLVNGNRTIAVNEQMESSAAYGWAKPVNNIIRYALSSLGFSLGGDLTGTLPNPTVAKVNGATIATAAPGLTDGYFLRATGASTADWKPVTMVGDVVGTNVVNTCTLAGDVTGRTGVTVVGKVKGTTITTAGGALPVGAVLRTTAVGTADWGQVNLADTDAITGVLPTANRPAPVFAAVGMTPISFPTPLPGKIDLGDGYTNLSNGMTISTANNNITVLTAGYYKIYVSLTAYTSNNLRDEIQFRFYKNGTGFNTGDSQYPMFLATLPGQTALGGFGYVPISFECVASLAVNDVIDIRVINTSLNSPDNRSIWNGVFGMTLL